MITISRIDSLQAYIRKSKGVFEQVSLYSRGESVLFRAAGGFVEVRGQNSNGAFFTSHPDIMLLDYDKSDSLVLVKQYGHEWLRFAAPEVGGA